MFTVFYQDDNAGDNEIYVDGKYNTREDAEERCREIEEDNPMLTAWVNDRVYVSIVQGVNL